MRLRPLFFVSVFFKDVESGFIEKKTASNYMYLNSECDVMTLFFIAVFYELQFGCFRCLKNAAVAIF